MIVYKQNASLVKLLTVLFFERGGSAYQSELKRLFNPRTWFTTLKREIRSINELFQEEFGMNLFDFTQQKNPRTGRSNEVLVSINPEALLRRHDSSIVIEIERGDKT